MIQRNKIVKNEAQNYALENKRRKEENIHRELHYQTDLQKERKRLCPKSTNYFRVNDGREGWTTVGSSIEGLAKNEREMFLSASTDNYSTTNRKEINSTKVYDGGNSTL